MRRPLLPIAAVLATVTALVLAGAALAISPPGLPANADGEREAANRAVVTSFYDAANTVIASGDPALLASLIDPGFVERETAAGAAMAGDGLIRRLLAVHAAAPTVQLAVDALAADGDLVIAHVRVEGFVPTAALGLRLDAAWTPWGPLDAFRIEGGRIAERWGPVGDPAPATPALQVALDIPAPMTRTLGISRVKLQAGAHYEVSRQSGPRVVLAESGAIGVEPAAASGPGTEPATTLTAGEHLSLPANATVVVRNASAAPAVLVEIVLAAQPFAESASQPTAPSPASGVAVQTIAADLLVARPAPTTTLSVGRAALEPGERLGWLAAAGPVLIHVEAGTVALAAAGSVPWTQGIASEHPAVTGETRLVKDVLTAGGGALLEAGAVAEVRADPAEPATLLIVTLLPG